MKKAILVLGALGAAVYFGLKALYATIWRASLVACLLSPAAMGVWLAYAINVKHWQMGTLWVMPPLIVLSLFVGGREFSWTEPLIRNKTR